MKVSLSWLRELVDLKVSMEELIRLLPLRTIGIKEVTSDFIELDMKGYNRADLLSMRGVAREIAAITGSAVRFSDKTNGYNESLSRLDVPSSKVVVEDTKLCPLYCVAKIEGLKVGPSSKDWVKKLADCGIRSIDTVTDITNLIMLEFGQTMHAFDADKVADETMIVRLARDGEQFSTLDGKKRILTSEDLLITDPKGILSLSGIMGGKDSEISENTNKILLEVAIFDPVSIRKSSQRFGLHSEASKRFQHGLTKTNLLQALSAAIKMYEGLGGKLTAISLVGDLEDKPKVVNLRQQKVNSLIGIKIPPAQIKSSLESLGFKVGSPLRSNDNILRASEASREVQLYWEVTVPYWRLDVNIEEDLIEEVARIYGYEKIPAKPLEGDLPEKIDQSLPNFIYDLKKALADLGLTEVQTYSFYSTQVLNALGFNESNRENIIRVANPISSETQYLREFIWPNLVEVVGKNIRQGYKDIGIFEIGKVYLPVKGDLPKESYRLAIALMNGSDNPVEELTAIVEHLRGVGQINLKLHLGGEREAFFHPKRFATIEANGKVIGGLAEVHPRFLNNFGIEKRVAILEISLENS